MAIIVKAGGTVVAEEHTVATLLRELNGINEPALFVHGGGKAVTEIAGQLGIVSTFRDGVRLTQPREMQVVDMVLAGSTNTELVRIAHRSGLGALGLTGADGGLLTGRILYPEAGGRTAEVARVHLDAVFAAHHAGLLPILATVGIGEDGGGVNINADEAAQAISREWARQNAARPVRLVFISDIPGVLDGDGKPMSVIDAAQVERLIAEAVVQGGMAAKLRSCAEAVRSGVERIVIGGYRETGDLSRLLHGTIGTTVVAGDDAHVESVRKGETQ